MFGISLLTKIKHSVAELEAVYSDRRQSREWMRQIEWEEIDRWTDKKGRGDEFMVNNSPPVIKWPAFN